MKPLLIATTNPGKVSEFQELLGGRFHCQSADHRAPTVIEDGKNYRENAEKKARGFFSVYQIPVLSDDSGIEIDALNGEPGLYSARFGGEQKKWPERWQYTYDRLKGVPQEKWTARFRSVLCYFDGKTVQFFEGVTEGRVCPTPKGDKGFGYDPIFYSFDLQKTFGEASPSEKESASHRARAAHLFLTWFHKNVS